MNRTTRRSHATTRRVSAVGAGVLIASGLATTAAHAAVNYTVTGLGTATTAGATNSVTITNNGDPVNAFRVLPSCGDTIPNTPPLTCPNGSDTNVFTLSFVSVATCDGVTGVNIASAAGVFTITPVGAPAFPTGCVLTLNRTALRVPTVDTAGAGGIQTNWNTSALVGTAETLGAGDTVTVAQATTLITTTPSAGGPVGTAVSDRATINNRVGNVDGRLIFTLYSDAACTNVVYTTAFVPQNGTGPYNSGPFTPTAPGTYYWQVEYLGDVNNAGDTTGCGGPTDERVVITGPTPGPGTGLGACDLNSAAFQDALADGYQLHFVGPSHHYTGGSDRELIIGTNGPDVIDGGSNDDIICGLGGRDRIDGGSGNDQIDGGNGHDVIDGGSGNDTIVDIENGRDTVISSSGNDTIT
jgi:hypothetical protein